MKVAVVADIHGNRWALDAVIADMARQDVDLVINAGDMLSGPLEPAETAERLMALGWASIQGNHERQLLACAHAPGAASDQYAYTHTAAHVHDWLRGLPTTLQWPDAGIYVCHGAPDNDLAYFLEEVEPHGARAACNPAVELRAAGISAGLILCGHSHQPRVHALCDGRLVVNPGSVGLQAYDDERPFHHFIENGSPHARYAVCEQRAGGWDVDLRAVAYDHLAAARAARAHGSEAWGYWLETGLARAA